MTTKKAYLDDYTTLYTLDELREIYSKDSQGFTSFNEWLSYGLSKNGTLTEVEDETESEEGLCVCENCLDYLNTQAGHQHITKDGLTGICGWCEEWDDNLYVIDNTH